MDYDVYFIEQKTDDHGDVCGGDDWHIKTLKSEMAALKFARKKSLCKTFNNGASKVHEVFVRMEDKENDSISVWFIKNGKITHQDIG